LLAILAVSILFRNKEIGGVEREKRKAKR